MPDGDSLPALRPNATPVPTAPLAPDVVEKLVANQSRELELRAADLALQQQKDNNAFAFGKEALSAKAADLKDQRKHQFWKTVITFGFIAFLVVVTVGLIGYAMHSGKDAMASEIIKAVIYVGGGAVGGYGLARSRSGKASQSDADEGGE